MQMNSLTTKTETNLSALGRKTPRSFGGGRVGGVRREGNGGENNGIRTIINNDANDVPTLTIEKDRNREKERERCIRHMLSMNNP